MLFRRYLLSQLNYILQNICSSSFVSKTCFVEQKKVANISIFRIQFAKSYLKR